jgi:hypothetical protein
VLTTTVVFGATAEAVALALTSTAPTEGRPAALSGGVTPAPGPQTTTVTAASINTTNANLGKPALAAGSAP